MAKEGGVEKTFLSPKTPGSIGMIPFGVGVAFAGLKGCQRWDGGGGGNPIRTIALLDQMASPRLRYTYCLFTFFD